MNSCLTIQELYDYCKVNNCTDLKVNIFIKDEYHKSEFINDVTLKDLECDTETGCFIINTTVNEV